MGRLRSAIGLIDRLVERTERRVPAVLVLVFAVALGVLWLRVRSSGWQLVGDEAVIVMRARDVVGEGSPLLGMPSAFTSWSSAADPFHPGPSPFWMIAPFTVLLGSTVDGALLATWVLVVGAIASVLFATARMLGPHRVWWAGGCLLGVLVIDGQLWRPLTPVMVVVPALAVLFLTWTIVGGETGRWPLLAFFASLTIHADLAYLPTSATLLVLALVATLVRWRRSVRLGAAPPMSGRLVAATTALTLLLWGPPFVDAVVNGGGNALELVRAATAGVDTRGWVDAVGSGRSTIAILALCLLLGALTAWTTDPASRALGVTALVGTLAAVGGQAATPASAGVQPLYRLPLDVSIAFLIFSVGVLVIQAIPRLLPFALPAPLVRLAGIGALVPLTLAIVLVLPAGTSVEGGWLSESFPSIAPLASETDAVLPDGEYEFRALGGPRRIGLGHAMALNLQELGVHVRVERGLARYLGAHRERSGGERGTLYLTAGSDRAPTATARAVARWESPHREELDAHEIRRAAAAAVRDDPAPVITGTSLWVGAVVAGSGVDARYVKGFDEDGLNATGQWFLDDPSRIHELSDLSITKLLAEGLMQVPSAVAERIATLDSAPLLVVWLDPLDPQEAEPPLDGGARATDGFSG